MKANWPSTLSIYKYNQIKNNKKKKNQRRIYFYLIQDMEIDKDMIGGNVKGVCVKRGM